MQSKKLVWHIFPVNLFITLGAMFLVTWYGSVTLHSFYNTQMAESLEDRAWLIEDQVIHFMSSGQYKELEEFCRKSGRKSFTRITVILPSGVVIADSNEDAHGMENHGDRPEIKTAFKGETGSSVRFSATLAKNMLYVAVPLYAETGISNRDKGNAPLAVLRVSLPVSAIDHILYGVQLKIAFGAILVAIVAAIGTMVVARRISRPLELIKEGAERFAKGDFEKPLALSEDMALEVQTLSDSMNHMARQLEERINTIVQQRNEQNTVLSSMLESVIVVDTKGKVVGINKAASKLLNIRIQDAAGKSIQEVIRNIHLQRLVGKILASDKAVMEEIVLAKEGRDLFLQTNGVKLFNSGGKSFGALMVLNDVTRLRRLETVRRDFVANVSHELKTPITSIKGYAETILDSGLADAEQAKKFLEIIVRQSNQLHAIVNDLLSLARIEQETDKEDIVVTRGKVGDVLQAAVQVCSVKAQEKDIAIHMDCVDDLQCVMDSSLMEQAVSNLVINAIKYSDPGGRVEIRGYETEQDGEEMIAVSVRDYGVGIGKEHLPRLFERFYRSDKARSRKLGGTGLGLAIVKHIAQAHNGKVSVESELGKGSVFTILLPINKGD
ncbi:MAG: PAS domain-containing protein [Desulfobulbaceae bacterium]|uniref:histidine kinase n=1 Tax=Candidatus Desulfobia pelagia TaxID=2841692 RepID=A0A8J6NFT1_9BACT|nr:PAS domain-containing protein [Candidatus Desulfobia pelagia]